MAGREHIARFLANRSIALVGASRSGRKFGNLLLRELRSRGYRILPVHPHAKEIEGEAAYSGFDALPEPVEAAILVLPPRETERVVGNAADAGVKTVWMQYGAHSREAVRICGERGIDVISGECVMMHAMPVRSVHRLHRCIWKILGRLD